MLFCNLKDEEIFRKIHWQNQKINLKKVTGNNKIHEYYKKICQDESFKDSPSWLTPTSN